MYKLMHTFISLLLRIHSVIFVFIFFQCNRDYVNASTSWGSRKFIPFAEVMNVEKVGNSSILKTKYLDDLILPGIYPGRQSFDGGTNQCDVGPWHQVSKLAF